MGVQTTCEDFQKKPFCFTCVEKSAKVLYVYYTRGRVLIETAAYREFESKQEGKGKKEGIAEQLPEHEIDKYYPSGSRPF